MELTKLSIQQIPHESFFSVNYGLNQLTFFSEILDAFQAKGRYTHLESLS